MRVKPDYHVAAIAAITAPHSNDVSNDSFTFIGSDLGPSVSPVVPQVLINPLNELISKGNGSHTYSVQARNEKRIILSIIQRWLEGSKQQTGTHTSTNKSKHKCQESSIGSP